VLAVASHEYRTAEHHTHENPEVGVRRRAEQTGKDRRTNRGALRKGGGNSEEPTKTSQKKQVNFQALQIGERDHK